MVVFGSKAWLAEKKREQEKFLQKEIARLKEASRKAQILRKQAGMEGKGALVKVIDDLKKKAEEMKQERIKKQFRILREQEAERIAKEAREEEAARKNAVEEAKPVRVGIKKIGIEPITKIDAITSVDTFPLKAVIVGMVGIAAAALYFMRRKKK